MDGHCETPVVFQAVLSRIDLEVARSEDRPVEQLASVVRNYSAVRALPSVEMLVRIGSHPACTGQELGPWGCMQACCRHPSLAAGMLVDSFAAAAGLAVDMPFAVAERVVVGSFAVEPFVVVPSAADTP